MRPTTMLPDELDLLPVSRWPTTLPEASARAVLDTPVAERVKGVARPAGVPLVSIVTVTLDGLLFSRICLESLLATATTVNFEVIVVDNGSTDGTDRYLAELAALDARVVVHRHRHNVGFAAATNAGAARARGSVLVLLNNDTIVPDGTLERVLRHLNRRGIGLLGAVTNRAGNEAQIEAPYRTYGEFRQFARRQALVGAENVLDIRTATMFCAAMRADVWRVLGPLDERFEIGLFEDDDYSMRARHAGYRVVCAEDVFVHHFGQASIGRLAATGEYGRVFHANRARWETKWGTEWQPYQRREQPRYRQLVDRIRAMVCECVPAGATVAVISKGDADLVTLDDRRAWHFPQNEDGVYAGHHPANDAECIAELERLAARGAEYLVIPAPAMWWLDHYRGFARYLRSHCRWILDAPECAVVMCTPTEARPRHTGSAAAHRESVGV